MDDIDWNEQEFVAKQLARLDGKIWRDLPNSSALWFKDREHYRRLASAALRAKRLWDAHRAYSDTFGASTPLSRWYNREGG